MANQITQETFDEAVKENMEEFGMSAEEAIADAQTQFETQGVDLANIVRDLRLYDGSNNDPSKHPIVSAIESISQAQEKQPLDEEGLKESLTLLRKECDVGLSQRCLAGKNQAYTVLLSALENHWKTELQGAILETMCSLLNGQPDLLDYKGMLLLMEILSSVQNNTANKAKTVRLIRLTCVMHEANRQNYVEEGLITKLINTLEANNDNSEVVKEVCSAFRVLTLDDDPRVPFGKAHEHAKMIVKEGNALNKILHFSKDYSTNQEVLGELFLTLSRLAVRNEFCQEIMDLGGISLMLNALEQNIDQQSIVCQALIVLKAIAGNDDVKRAISKSGGIELILASINKHLKHSKVCEIGCSTLATLALRQPEHCQIIVENSGPEILMKVMQLHPNKPNVLKQACMAVRNTVARSRQYCPMFLEQGAEMLIQNAMSSHKECHDEAKAALRDLGCEVEFVVLWKHEGRGIKA